MLRQVKAWLRPLRAHGSLAEAPGSLADVLRSMAETPGCLVEALKKPSRDLRSRPETPVEAPRGLANSRPSRCPNMKAYNHFGLDISRARSSLQIFLFFNILNIELKFECCWCGIISLSLFSLMETKEMVENSLLLVFLCCLHRQKK